MEGGGGVADAPQQQQSASLGPGQLHRDGGEPRPRRNTREGSKGTGNENKQRDRNDRRRGRHREEKAEEHTQQFTIAKPAIPAVPAITVVQRDTAQASVGPTGSKRKFLDENFEICFESVFKILAEQPEFTVVGVLGSQGVGKSTVLSALSGHKNSEDAFVIQGADKEIEGRHETTGIDITVSPERFLLLDTQALFSMSVLTDMIKTEHPIPADVVSYENLHDLQSIQLAVFLMRVCHIVVVVEECVPDWNTVKFLKLVEMLRYNIPDVASPVLATPGTTVTEENNEYQPEVVFVVNKTRDQSLDNKQSTQKLLNHALVDANFRRCGSVSWAEMGVEKSPEDVNLFFIPAKGSDVVNPTPAGAIPGIDGAPFGHAHYEEKVACLRDQILSIKRSAFSRSITERDWVRNCVKVWELTRTSSFISEFNRTMQQMQLYRT